MRRSLLFRLLDPIAGAIGRQLALPSGWFGRTIMTRALNRGNRALIEATLSGVPLAAETRLLDVGFGGGLLLELAAARGVRALAGVDPSEAAVAALRARAVALGAAELRLQVGAVEALPFPDRTFDVVATTNTVYFWADLVRAFSELHRVLRPGGVVTVGFSGAAKLRAHGKITRSGFRFHEAGDVAAAARAAGFTEVRVTELHGRVTEGDHVLRGSRGPEAAALT